MTGPEHYAEAERLLQKAQIPYVVTLPDRTPMNAVDHIKSVLAEHGLDESLVATESVRIDVTPLLLAAQVHATLALTAAQTLQALGDPNLEPAWLEAVSS